MPTFEESGYPGFDGVQWYGIVGPGEPARRRSSKRLNEEINKALASPELRERLSGEALEPMPMTPEQFGQYIRDDIARWTKLAKERNIEITDDPRVADEHRPSAWRTTRRRADANAPPVTRILAEFVATHPSRGWSDAVEREAHRTFLNWLGCAIGASRHPTVEAALAAVQELGPAPQATLLGRRERVDIGERRAGERHLVAHVRLRRHAPEDDHPSRRARSRRRCSRSPSTGRERAAQLIDALVLGIDVACRVGNVIYPDHYDRGWHITGSTGMLGAAAACARLLRLDAQRTAMALGIAASQPVGVREQFGTMTKPFHPGAAARAGLIAALLAKHGFTASAARARGAARLRADVLDQVRLERDHRRARRALRDLVQHVQAVRLRHRHPPEHRRLRAAARGARRCTPADIERIDLRVHPLVLELTGKKAPRTASRASSASTTRAPPASSSARRARASSPTTMVARRRRGGAARPRHAPRSTMRSTRRPPT